MLSCSRTLAILGAVNYSVREKKEFEKSKPRQKNSELLSKSR